MPWQSCGRPHDESTSPDTSIDDPQTEGETATLPTSEPERVVVESVFQSEAAMKTAITESLQPLILKTEAVTTRVNAAFKDFKASAAAKHEPQRRNYIEPGADVAAAVDKVVMDRVDTLRTADTTAGIRFRRGDDVPTNGGPDGTVDLGAVLKLIGEKRRGTSLVTRPAVAACRIDAQADGILAKVEGVTQAVVAETGTGNGTNGQPDASEFVKDAVTLQMHTATSPEARLEYGTMPKIPNTANADEVQGVILDTFELRPGASDVTSYHDFHTLHIAFEHVWSQIFDGELEKLGRDLYDEYVQLKNFCGSEAADPPVSSLDDLSALMTEVRRLSERVERQLPVGFTGPPEQSSGAKSANELETVAKVGLAVATGGLSSLVEWAVEEFSKIGRKPVITWESFPGPWAPRTDRIERTLTTGVHPAPLVEIALRTDNGSHLKIVELELFDEATRTFVHGPRIDNGGNRTYVSVVVPTPFLATGVIEFASQQTPGMNLGRYILSNLARSIPGGSRVTFYWKDS